MRLLKRDNGRLTFVDNDDFTIPYAILSHTWDAEELSFQDVQNGRSNSKIQFLLDRAERDGLAHAWIDTCCVNKWDSTEFAEAINSMYKWYAKAELCYVYLADMPAVEFERSRWFTRGWTLQELIAPAVVQFFDSNGQYLGVREELSRSIHSATQIDMAVLRGATIQGTPLATRYAWSIGRQTKKSEDMIYCLLGLLEVSLPVVYGEEFGDTQRRLFRSIEEKYGRQVVAELQRFVKGHGKAVMLTSEQLMASLRYDGMDKRRNGIRLVNCDWLLQHPEYKKWARLSHGSTPTTPKSPISFPLEHIPSTLWIKGDTGAGKSTLMRSVEQKTSRSWTTTGISFYFDASSPLGRSTVGMYRSLLFQLCERIHNMADVACDYLQTVDLHVDGTIQWTTETLRRLFKHCIESLSHRQVCCFVDAIDECDERDVKDMLQLFSSLPHFTACMASRHYSSVRSCTEIRLEQQSEHVDSIRRYVEKELNLHDNAFGRGVRQQVVEKSEGNFLWTLLVVRMLNRELSRRNGLDWLPGTIKSYHSDLDGLYRQVLSSDNAQFQMLIQLVTFAKPTVSELYHAVQSHPAGSVMPTPALMEAFIVDCSRGLVQVHEGVSFIHESVRDFLIEGRGLQVLFPEVRSNLTAWSHDCIKKLLVQHLVQDYAALWRAGVHSMEDPREWCAAQGMPLLYLAATTMLYHAEQAITDLPQEGWFATFNWTLLAEAYALLFAHQDSYIRNLHAMGLMALQRAPRLAAGVLRLGSNITLRRLLGPCAMAEAVRSQDARFVQLLLDRGVAVNDRDDHGHMPLALASNELALLLLKHEADPNSTAIVDGDTVPVLSLCLERGGDDRLLRDLLHRGADIEGKGSLRGMTALMLACKHDLLDAVDMLLVHGAKVDAKAANGMTPLFFVNINNGLSIARALLQNGADVNSVDKAGESVLSAAIQRHDYGPDQMLVYVELLLSKGANPAFQHRTSLVALANERGEEFRSVALLLRGAMSIPAASLTLLTRPARPAVAFEDGLHVDAEQEVYRQGEPSSAVQDLRAMSEDQWQEYLERPLKNSKSVWDVLRKAIGRARARNPSRRQRQDDLPPPYAGLEVYVEKPRAAVQESSPQAARPPIERMHTRAASLVRSAVPIFELP